MRSGGGALGDALLPLALVLLRLAAHDDMTQHYRSPVSAKAAGGLPTLTNTVSCGSWLMPS